MKMYNSMLPSVIECPCHTRSKYIFINSKQNIYRTNERCYICMKEFLDLETQYEGCDKIKIQELLQFMEHSVQNETNTE